MHNTLPFIVLRRELNLNDNIWTEWTPIGAFPDKLNATSYADTRMEHDWCKSEYKVVEFSA